MEETWFIPLWAQLILAAGFLAAFGAGAFLAIRLLMKSFSGGGGWTKLAKAYATTRPLPAQHMQGQIVQVGRVVYKRCVDVSVTDAGLHMRLTGIAAIHPETTVLIPWSEFDRSEPTRLFWEPAHTLHVGRPAVTTLCVLEPLFEAMRAHLPSKPV